jgi:hypothetical protein
MNRFYLLGGAHIFQLVCSVLGTVMIFRSLTPADIGTVVSIVAINGVLAIPVAACFGKVYSALLVDPDGANLAAPFYAMSLAVIGLLALLPVGLVALFYSDPVYTLLAGVLALLAFHKLNLRHAENAERFGRIATARIVAGVMILATKALSAWLVAPYLFAASFVLEHAIYCLALPVRGAGGARAVARALASDWRLPHVQSVAKLLPTEFAASLSLKYPLLMFGALSMPEAAALYNAAIRLRISAFGA